MLTCYVRTAVGCVCHPQTLAARTHAHAPYDFELEIRSLIKAITTTCTPDKLIVKVIHALHMYFMVQWFLTNEHNIISLPMYFHCFTAPIHVCTAAQLAKFDTHQWG